MGRIHRFHCPGCNYDAEVSGGGDAGMEVTTTTIVCLDCKKLFDFVLGPFVAVEFEDGRTNRKKPRCPKKKTHRVQEWNNGDPCPICGTVMEQKELVVMWD